MARHKRFTFLCNQNEHALIVDLAERLSRSQSDAVRFVVLEAARELETQGATPTDAAATRAQSHDVLPTTHGKGSRRRRIFGMLIDYLGLGIILDILISFASLILFPDWARSNLTLVILFFLCFGVATAFIASFRQAYE